MHAWVGWWWLFVYIHIPNAIDDSLVIFKPEREERSRNERMSSVRCEVRDEVCRVFTGVSSGFHGLCHRSRLCILYLPGQLANIDELCSIRYLVPSPW